MTPPTIPACAPHKEPPPPLDRRSALFLDVDGTLLDIAPRPELVRVPAELPPLLDRLAAEREGALALVSGRRLADLDRLFPAWRRGVAGLHGGERRRADGSIAPNEAGAEAALAALDRLRPRLAGFAAAASGVRFEDKGGTVALHYRDAPAMADEVLAFAGSLRHEAGDGLRLIAGKMVVELQPRHFSKGGAVAAFMAEPPFRDRRPVFLGDDTTDEDGFAEINRRHGLSIRVGAPNALTAAAYCLPTIAAALAWLAGCHRR